MSCINAIQIFMQVPVVEVEVVFFTSSTTSTWRGGGPARPHRRRTAVGWCTALCSNRPPAAHAAHCQAASSQRVRASDRQQTPVRNSVGPASELQEAAGRPPHIRARAAGGGMQQLTTIQQTTNQACVPLQLPTQQLLLPSNSCTPRGLLLVRYRFWYFAVSGCVDSLAPQK